MAIDVSALVAEGEIAGEDEEETALLKEFAAEARSFISGFPWCREVVAVYLGLGVGGVVGVALVNIAPARREVDECLWVVVGDLPPLYLTEEAGHDPASALATYISLMREWVAAVREGTSLDEVVPVDAAPTREHADMLESRLSFLEQEVLSRYHRHGDSGLRRAQDASAPRIDGGDEEYQQFLRVCLDRGQLWGLERSDEWALAEGAHGEDAVPVWGHEEAARERAVALWADKRPRSISFEDWLEVWLPHLIETGASVRIFTPAGTSQVVSPERLREDLVELRAQRS